MRHLGRFFATFVLILVPPYLYLGYSLAGDDHLSWVLLAVPFVSILLLPLLVGFTDRHRAIWWRDYGLHLAHLGMGVTTYLTITTLARDVLHQTAVAEIATPWIFGLTSLALALGFLIAITGPRIKRVRIRIEQLPEALRGFRILQISDLHVGTSISPRYVKRVVRMSNGLEPDLVALTGDIADGDRERTEPGVKPLAELKSRHGTFYVPGNHEYYWDVEGWVRVFRELNCSVLLNAGLKLSRAGGDVWIGGITDPAAEDFGAEPPSLEGAWSADAAECAVKILLSHRPGFARAAVARGFDLQLSGHTHGGQFFPWTLVVAFVHEFHLGLRRVGRGWIYVSPGTGTWGPLLRLGTVPELTLITLER